MTTKYIVNNATGQTITGSLTISGKTSLLSSVPTNISGSAGDKLGELAFDENYLYYCSADFTGTSITVEGGTPTHIFDAEPESVWDVYGSNYLQVGPSQEIGVQPLNGWYMVDDNGTIRQVIGGYWNSPEAPASNGTGWLMTLDGPFTYSSNNTTITFYETLPTVTTSGGDIWKTLKLDSELNTTAVYRALLTQTGSIVGYSLGDFNQGLIIGEEYTITNYNNGDDFSNIANVISGNINETGCVFVATGEIPLNYGNSSELTSGGGLVVTVLENTLGYDLDWSWAPFGGSGYYVAFNNIYGPINNAFPRSKVDVKTQLTYPFNPPYYNLTVSPAGFMGKDNMLSLNVFDIDFGQQANDILYYTPIEIKIKQDNTPFIVNGTIDASFPFNNVSFYMYCNGNLINTYYTNNGSQVNDITELVNMLNSEPETNFLGVYSDNGSGGVNLTITNDIKDYFCQDGSLTITIFQD